jgi:hypothetical protein
MAIEIRKAERRKAKLRVGLFGPSGSGKTMSALKLARGLASDWSKICVIDTENNSADLYSHLGDYNVISLGAPYSPEAYIEAILAVEKAGMEVLIIDSITHEWAGPGGILEIVDMKSKDAKNSFSVWGDVTPRHNHFIDTILQVDLHVICCGRSKQEYALNQVEKNGRTISVPEKIGLRAVTRDGFDYEMTVSFELPISHLANSTKDRTGLFQDKPEHIISEETGKKLLAWSNSGANVAIDILREKARIMDHLRRLKIPFVGSKEQQAAFIRHAVFCLTEMSVDDEQKLPAIARALENWSDAELAYAAINNSDAEQWDYSVHSDGQQQAATPPPTPAVNTEAHG